MATRLYPFNHEAMADVPNLAVRGTYSTGATIGACNLMTPTKNGQNSSQYTYTITDTSATLDYSSVGRIYTSPPLQAFSFTTSHTINWCFRMSESNIAANAYYKVTVYIMRPDGTVRGTLLSNWTGGTEFSTTPTANSPGAINFTSNVSALAEDRLVIELGVRFNNSVTTSYQALIHSDYGHTTTDLVNGDTVATDKSAWFEVSPNISFQGDNLYWVGNAGTFTDSTKWSRTSGGSGGAAVPYVSDNAIFDGNSFNANFQMLSLPEFTIKSFDMSAIDHPVFLNPSSYTLYSPIYYGGIKLAGTDVEYILRERFSGNYLNTNIWSPISSLETVTTNLNIPTGTASGSLRGVSSIDTYDVSNTMVWSDIGTVGTYQAGYDFYPLHIKKDSSNSLYWKITNTNFGAFKKVAGTVTQVATYTYPTVNPRVVRIREYAGTTYWEYRSTTSAVWVVAHSEATPFVVTSCNIESFTYLTATSTATTATIISIYLKEHPYVINENVFSELYLHAGKDTLTTVPVQLPGSNMGYIYFYSDYWTWDSVNSKYIAPFYQKYEILSDLYLTYCFIFLSPYIASNKNIYVSQEFIANANEAVDVTNLNVYATWFSVGDIEIDEVYIDATFHLGSSWSARYASFNYSFDRVLNTGYSIKELILYKPEHNGTNSNSISNLVSNRYVNQTNQKVIINGTQNDVGEWVFEADSDVEFERNITYEGNTFTFNGTALEPITISYDTTIGVGTYTLNASDSPIVGTYLNASYSTVTGATWLKGTGFVDGGNNTGWVDGAVYNITKSADYDISFSTTIDKTAQYTIIEDYNIQKTSDYNVGLIRTIPLNSTYEVVGQTIQKKYMYKVYSSAGVYLDTWVDDVMDFQIREELNTAGSVITLKLPRPADNFGEGSSVDYANRVEVYVIDKEAPNGLLRFTGFITAYESDYSEESVTITVSSYGAELQNHIMHSGSNTTVTYSSQDPSTILKAILDEYNADGGNITYDINSIDTTGTTVSYTFNTNTVKEGIDKCLELAPENWYYYVDQATNLFHFHELETIPAHTISIGRNIKSIKIKKDLEKVINTVYFSGGGDPPMFKKYTIPASITAYGIRGARYKDGRVTVTDTALKLSNKLLRGDPEILVTLSLVDSNLNNFGYDLESITIGETIKIGSSGIGPSSQYDIGTYDTSPFDYDLSNLSSIVFQITSLTFTGDEMEFTLATTPPDITKRIQDINRNLLDIQNNDNPTAPS